MKKLISMLLCLVLAFTVTAAALAETVPFGMLSMLNMTEDECVNYVFLRTLVTGVLMMEEMADSALMTEEEGTEDWEMDEDVDSYAPKETDEDWEGAEEESPSVVFFDSLDAMLMALNAGDIYVMDVYQSVAKYLCAQNDNLAMGWEFPAGETGSAFADKMLKLSVSHAESDGATRIDLFCGGAAYDPFAQEEDGLGVTILKKMAKQMDYRLENSMNRIAIIL